MASAPEYWVWLGLAFGSGSGKTDEIIRRCGDLAALYENPALARLAPQEEERLRAVKLSDAKRVTQQMDARGIAVITPDDARYPDRLRNIYGRPVTLYVEGELGDLDNELAIAMVGTRRYSDYGYTAANKIGTELARAGAVIVSGLAKGIDTICHTAAVKCGQRTVAVLGCGIDQTYPPQNKTLRELIAKNGAVITEFAPGTPPRPQNFPIRNRIISGLAMGVVVVEAGLRSGSLITANIALEQGKDIFAVPNDIFNENARGTFHLLRQGAIPVSCGLDVLEEYRYRFAGTLQLEQLEPVRVPKTTSPPARLQTTLSEPPVPPAPQKSEPEGLSENGRQVYALLTELPMQIEEIAEKLQKPVYEVLTGLTELEIIGLASAQSGKRYRRAER